MITLSGFHCIIRIVEKLIKLLFFEPLIDLVEGVICLCDDVVGDPVDGVVDLGSINFINVLYTSFKRTDLESVKRY